jgi:transposase
LCRVRWYRRFKLSLRDLVETMARRGIYLAPTKIMRGIAIGRGDWTLAGSDAGGHGAAVVATPIEICELNDADPPAWLAHVLAKPRDRPAKRRDEWPPWDWTPRRQALAEAA